MVGWVGDSVSAVSLHVYADADFAGCTDTQRSTSGFHLQMRGPHACFPLSSAALPESRSAKVRTSTGKPAIGGPVDVVVCPDCGALQPIAAKVLMEILYAARMARFDLLRAVCQLACCITKWTEECDHRLHRLACYIHRTKPHRMVGWVGDPANALSLHLYADADFRRLY